MTKFRRGLTVEQWAGLRVLQDAAGNNWWKDLLNLWALPGHSSHDHGLRLCVHLHSLDFYRRGQRIAHVCFGHARSGVAPARMEIHERYVHGRKGGKVYLTMGAEGLPYEGQQGIERCIARSVPKHGSEKWAVDDIVGNNPGVVDLEMGIPGSALRVDIVSLAEGTVAPLLLLWEAKPLNSNDLRLENDGPAKIISQINKYKAFCSEEENTNALEKAYAESCKTLVKLAQWAGKTEQLSKLIVRGQHGVSLDPQVGLLLFRGVTTDADGERGLVPYASNWCHHRAKLSGRGLRLKEKEDPKNIVLTLAPDTDEG